MKNKRRFFVIWIILFIIVLTLIFLRVKSTAQDSSSDLTSLLLSDATVTIPELDPQTTVKLTGRTTSFSPDDDPSDEDAGTVTVVGNAVGDSQTMYAILAVNAGGSGTFYYLSAFDKSSDGYIAHSFEPLGDRIDVESLTYTLPNDITVSYLTHGPTQTMADNPDEKVESTYTYSNGDLTKSK